MNPITIKHVKVSELPQAWRTLLNIANQAQVTVRIEEELEPKSSSLAKTFEDPAFGIWSDRTDMADVEVYMHQLRTPRYNRDGNRNEL